MLFFRSDTSGRRAHWRTLGFVACCLLVFSLAIVAARIIAQTPKSGPQKPGPHKFAVYISGTSQGLDSAPAAFVEARILDTASGSMEPVAGSPVVLNYGEAPDIALAPNGAFAYVLAHGLAGANDSDSTNGPSALLVFSLDSTSGAPKLRQMLPAGAPNAPAPTHIAVHPSGRFLYVSNYYAADASGQGIGIFAVRNDGNVVFVGVGGPIQPQASYGAAVNAAGNLLYTASDSESVEVTQVPSCTLFSTEIFAFHVEPASGALTRASGSPFELRSKICETGTAPQWLPPQIDPSGRRLFMIDAANHTINVLAIEPSTGALTLLPGSTSDSGNSGPAFDAAAVDPKGRFLYVGGAGYSFTGFAIVANSAAANLPVLPGMPVQSPPTAELNDGSRTMAIDASGAFLLANQNDSSGVSCCSPDQLVEFRIDRNSGALTPVSSASVPLAGSASKIVSAQMR